MLDICHLLKRGTLFFSLNLRSDLTVPKIVKPNEVLVRIHAASIDLIDIALLSGLGRIEQTLFKCSNASPKVLGRDFSGVVLDVGRNVSHLEVGDQCWSAIPLAVRNGSLSEFVVMESSSVRLKPAHLSHDGAATLPYSSLIGKRSFTYFNLAHQHENSYQMGIPFQFGTYLLVKQGLNLITG